MYTHSRGCFVLILCENNYYCIGLKGLKWDSVMTFDEFSVRKYNN